MIANILHADPYPLPMTLGVGQNSTFSEHGHVAYQIKWNQECSIEQHGSKYFVPRPLHSPSPTLGWVNRSKLNFFRIWSLNAATW